MHVKHNRIYCCGSFVRLVALSFLLLSTLMNTVMAQTSQCDNAKKPTDKIIRLGTSTALSGPNQHLGRAMLNGVRSRINLANTSNELGDKRIKLIELDDSYEADSAQRNVTSLIEEHNVLAIVGNVGTPTAEVSYKIANNNCVVFFGAYTGANMLRKAQKFVFNYRASYEQEMLAIVEDMINRGITLKNVAFLLQSKEQELSGFGKAGYAAATFALNAHHFYKTDNLAIFTYPPNTLAIEPALTDLINLPEKPEAVIIVGSYQPSAKFIRFAHPLLSQTVFYNLSFPGATELAKLLPQINSRVFITQVIAPPQEECTTPCDLNSTNEVFREGYLSMDTLIDALKGIDGDITSHSLSASLEALETLQNGTSHSDHQFSDQVWMAQITNGTYQYQLKDIPN